MLQIGGFEQALKGAYVCSSYWWIRFKVFLLVFFKAGSKPVFSCGERKRNLNFCFQLSTFNYGKC